MIPRLLEIAVREACCANVSLLRIVLREAVGRRARVGVPRVHLDAAIDWICRAQDASGTGGVSRSYCVAWNPSFGTRGWLSAYPETTGYIIPTMFDYAELSGSSEIRERALRMAEWEIDVQMECGAVQGGMIGMPATPAVFNTGQVILGWVRSAEETKDSRFLEAAVKAGHFLVEQQDADGVWRRSLSQHTRPGPKTYNTRTAWALAKLAEATDVKVFRESAIRNIESALRLQQPNGWFSGNCLDNDDAPLTHTIAYATRGILETGILLGEERYIAAARLAATALIGCQREDGALPGRLDRGWRPMARWTCLTGNAQVAIIWLRLASVSGEDGEDARYRVAAQRGLRFVASLQDLDASDPGIRGGIAGAYPFAGDYGSFEYLNWAAKFFADGLIAWGPTALAELDSTVSLEYSASRESR